MFVTDVVLCVCKILLKSEQICGCCCKMLRGSLFWGHTVCSKNNRASEEIEANCHVRLTTQKSLLKYLSGRIFLS